MNRFPDVWFRTFLAPETAAPVDRELAFIQAHLPVADYPRLLDVPCGIGRHAGPLAAMGYDVLGIDRSEAALSTARRLYPRVEFHRGDMFALGDIPGSFDGLLCLWQSFGYGSSEQNRDLLRSMCRTLRPGGRLLLDVYNADAVACLPTEVTEERGGRTVRTRRSLEDRRLRVELTYSDWDGLDVHDWEVYTPSELTALATDAGLEVLIACAWFDSAVPPSADHLRMQLLCGRPADDRELLE